MRIAIFTETFLPKIDGIVNTLCYLLEHLALRGHQSLLFAPDDDATQYASTPIIRFNGVSFPLYPEVKIVPPTVNVREHLALFRPHVVHVVNPISLGVAGMWHARRMGIPVVASYHTDVPGFAERWGMPLLLFVSRLSPEKRADWLLPVLQALPGVRLDGRSRRSAGRLPAAGGPIAHPPARTGRRADSLRRLPTIHSSKLQGGGMEKKKVLFIGGSLNQTKMCHAVARHLQDDYDCFFTPYYADGLIHEMAQRGWTDFCVLGGRFRQQTEAYLRENGLALDYRGAHHDYDLIVTTSDLIVQKNLHGKKVVLIQEGMTDPENWLYYLVKWLRLPRYLASTSTNGLSDAYDYFCVASEGYRDFFVRKGVQAEKLVVTGIPNFDDVDRYRHNDFPYRDFVLVATSDARETFKYDNRQKFIREALAIANGRSLIFKLHPNEKVQRAKREIRALAPHALVLTEGCAEEMVANCETLICQYSTLAYVGLALGKEVHSYFDLAQLRRLMPMQNGGTSGRHIAQVCRGLLAGRRVQQRQGTPVYGRA